MKKWGKTFLGLLLCAALAMGLLPGMAIAASNNVLRVIVEWLPTFLRFRGDHTGNFLLHPKSRLCYTGVRRGCDSRLFLVHENS